MNDYKEFNDIINGLCKIADEGGEVGRIVEYCLLRAYLDTVYPFWQSQQTFIKMR